MAECGGLLYLLDRLAGQPMCGVLPATAELGGTLVLGYRDAVAATDSISHHIGERVTGHEFHRTELTIRPSAAPQPAWHWRGRNGQPVREGFVLGNVHASFLHRHPAANPGSVLRFVRAAEKVRLDTARLDTARPENTRPENTRPENTRPETSGHDTARYR